MTVAEAPPAKTLDPFGNAAGDGYSDPSIKAEEAEAEKKAAQKRHQRISRLLEEESLPEDARAKALYDQDFEALHILADEALAQNPEDIQAMVDKALAFGLAGDLENAEKYNLEALKLDPSNDTALNNLGCDYADMGKPDQALLMFKRAHEEYSKKNDGQFDPLITANVINALEETGNHAEAKIWRAAMEKEEAFDQVPRMTWKDAVEGMLVGAFHGPTLGLSTILYFQGVSDAYSSSNTSGLESISTGAQGVEDLDPEIT